MAKNLLELIFKSDIPQPILNEIHECLVTCFSTQCSSWGEPIEQTNKMDTVRDLDYLGIEQPSLVMCLTYFGHGPIDMFLVGRTHTYCPPECKPVSQPHLAPVCIWNSLVGIAEPCTHHA